jgi:hypothetical protein
MGMVGIVAVLPSAMLMAGQRASFACASATMTGVLRDPIARQKSAERWLVLPARVPWTRHAAWELEARGSLRACQDQVDALTATFPNAGGRDRFADGIDAEGAWCPATHDLQNLLLDVGAQRGGAGKNS